MANIYIVKKIVEDASGYYAEADVIAFLDKEKAEIEAEKMEKKEGQKTDWLEVWFEVKEVPLG